MNRSLSPGNPTVVSAFHTALFHQILLVALILAVAAIGWNVLRTVQFRHGVAPGLDRPTAPEPRGRLVLRVGFGLLWIVDGLLQAQNSMPLGLTNGVLQPAASSSPGWVQHLVNVAVTIWNDHPVEAAAATVWIQVGIGVLILAAPRGRWSRVAGMISVGWAAIVWVFGEAFGGMLGHGTSWLFGAPGAVLFYGVAGCLLALPEQAWQGRRLGRRLMAGMGAYFVAMAILQGWPGRGFWQGGRRGTLHSMVDQMSQTSQPGFLANWLKDFASFDAAHGWAVNMVVVVGLGAIGAALCTGRLRLIRPALLAAAVLGLADWVLVQDLGVFGGLGTDPNSMVPLFLLLGSGYLAMTRPAEVPAASSAPAPAAAGQPEPDHEPAPGTHAGWLDRLRPVSGVGGLLAVGASVMLLVGLTPMTVAAANPNADPLLTVAVDGTPNYVDQPAPPFDLVDQNGRPVSLEDLRGRAVALTFLDPVCTTDCPLIAQEFRQVDAALEGNSGRVLFVAIATNPDYHSVAAATAFDHQEGLDHLDNWLFLTGSLAALRRTWSAYGVQPQVVPAGAMVAHGDVAFLIDPSGRTREILDTAPGTGQAANSSFVSYLSKQLIGVLAK